MSQFLSPEVRFIERFGEAAAFSALDNDGTVALVGIAEKGPIGVPTRVTSLDDARTKFGRFFDGGELMFWLENFFANSDGTGEVFIVRTAHYTDITDSDTLTAATASLLLENEGPGYSLSGTSPAIVTAVGQSEMDIALSGEVAQGIAISTSLVGGEAIAAAIQAAVRALFTGGGDQADYDNFRCIFTEDGQYLLLNGSVGPTKTVVVTDAGSNNTADDFNLGLANGGTEEAAPIDAITVEANSQGLWGNGLDVSITQVNKVSTTLAADVLTGAQSIQLANQSGVVDGQILEITDLTAPINPQIFVEVDRIEGNLVFLTEPLTLTETIEGTGATPATVRSLEFELEVREGGRFVEKFQNLSMNPRNVTDYFATRINRTSLRIQVTDLGPPTPIEFQRPGIQSNSFLTGGLDGLNNLNDTDFVGDVSEENGLQALRGVETVNFVAVPDRPTVAVHQAMIALAGELDRFEVVLDPPVGLDEAGIVSHVNDNQLASDYASIYWPNLITSDPRNRVEDRLIAPSAYILGMRARNANTPGIGIATPPAGRQFMAVSIVDLEDQSTFKKTTRDLLVPNRINPIGGFQGNVGIFAFGVDTLLPGGRGNGVGEVQARAVVLRVKRDLTLIMQDQLLSSVADEETLSRLDALTTSYLRGIRSDGLLIGATEQDSFFVNFGPDLNPVDQLARGEVRGRVGLRLGRALKFIIIEVTEFVPGRSQDLNQ
jgi:hypothetical protein